MKKIEEKRFMTPGTHVMMGNVAMAEGAIAAGLKFFGGYPITPSTEVPEHLASRLPEVGGCFIQMEDELASINAVMGATLAGAKAMTATSGPGTSLMEETISYAANLELPFVICDVQRNGPGTGLVTAPHHNDVYQCKYGGNGEYEVIALAPMNCQELFDMTIEAFNLAETYRCPVYVMSDAYLGHIHEPVVIPPADEIKKRVIDRAILDKENDEKFSYRGKDGRVIIPPPPVLATPNFPAFLFSQPHGPNGLPVEEDRAQQFVEDIHLKIHQDLDEICKFDEYLIDDAEVIIIAYGLPARVSFRVVNMAREEGYKVGMLRLHQIWPFHHEKVRRMISPAKAIVFPEMNLGMMAGEVEKILRDDCRLYKVPKIGLLHHPEEIYTIVKEAAGR